MSIMEQYVAEAATPEVQLGMSPESAARAEFLEQELSRLRHPLTKMAAHENRQNQLVRFCEVRRRKPQRLAMLTIEEERVRWVTTLMAYGRLLWESLRPEA